MISIIDSAKTIFNNNNIVINFVEDIVVKIAEIFNIRQTSGNKYLTHIDKEIIEFKKLNDNLSKYLTASESISIIFQLINIVKLCSLSLKKIYNFLQATLDKTKNVETFLSQTYIDETIQFHRKIVAIHNKTIKEENNIISNIMDKVVNEEISILSQLIKNDQSTSATNIIKFVKKIQSLYHENPSTIDLYVKFLQKIFEELSNWIPHDKQTKFYIQTLIEYDKSKLFSNVDTKINTPKSALLNPYFKTFNLVPTTKLMSINDVSMVMFNKPAKNMNEFIKYCKEGDYGLIIIYKHIAGPITYDITKLLDWKIGQEFAMQHKPSYGVDIPLIKRTQTIDKVLGTKTKWKFSIESFVLKFTDYENEKEKFLVILDSLAENMYRINANFVSMNSKYFIRVSSVSELYKYCGHIKTPNKANERSRTSVINKLQIKQAIPHIFCPIKPDLEKTQRVSIIVDPKYLRNEIYLRLNEQFKEILIKKYQNGKKITNNYIYASIIHDETFLSVFSDIITKEFHTYLYSTYSEHLMGHIQIGEIIGSFLSTVYLYQRTFSKEMHDYFNNDPFNFEEDNIHTRVFVHFDSMIKHVLSKIVTNESNIYQTVLYKINLLKNTFI